MRFDGIQGTTVIDRKTGIVFKSDARDQARRQSLALRQNGLKGRWEVPNRLQAARAEKLLHQLGIKNISVKVVAEDVPRPRGIVRAE